jgi:HAD superfamily hydrolase (TIGR01509 family)
MSGLRAVVWDVDGTLAETEREGHRVAFNRAFAALGLSWQWDDTRYGELLTVAGGRERLAYDMATRTDVPASAADRATLAQLIHERKTQMYTSMVRDGLVALRPGVRSLLEECRAAGVTLGIATTTTRVNVEALLDATLGPQGRECFAVVVTGEDVARKKPDPEAYHRALAAMGVAPGAALAVEDSPDGVRAARAAALTVIVADSAYFAGAAIDGAAARGPGFDNRMGWQPAPVPPGEGPVRLDDLRRWWAAASSSFASE